MRRDNNAMVVRGVRRTEMIDLHDMTTSCLAICSVHSCGRV
jgi:hypothetical protein